MISDYFPEEKRAKAISVYTMGLYLGAATAPSSRFVDQTAQRREYLLPWNSSLQNFPAAQRWTLSSFPLCRSRTAKLPAAENSASMQRMPTMLNLSRYLGLLEGGVNVALLLILFIYSLAYHVV